MQSELIERHEEVNRIVRDVFDNDTTFLYKLSQYYFELPTRLIFTAKKQSNLRFESSEIYEDEKYFYVAISSLINYWSKMGKTLNEIYKQINKIKKVEIEDFVMSYVINYLKSISLINLKEINSFYQEVYNLEGDHYESLDQLKEDYSIWRQSLLQEFEKESKIINSITSIQSKLNEINNLTEIYYSPIFIDSIITSFNPKINNRPVTVEDGIDIFNMSVVSEYVPFIRYNDSNKNTYIKVYNKIRTEKNPNYSHIIIPFNRYNFEDTIYLTLWLGDPKNDNTESLNEAKQESFFIVVYKLTNNYLTVETVSETSSKKFLLQDKTVAFQRVQNALPNINIGQGIEAKLRGSFNLWNASFEETSFLDRIMLDDLINVYLYVEENTLPFALKRRFDLHYRPMFSDLNEGDTPSEQNYIANSASVSVSLKQKYINDETLDVINFNPGDDYTTATIYKKKFKNVPYIHVNIITADSKDAINDFLNVFRLLISYYLEKEKETIKYYKDINFDVEVLRNLVKNKQKKIKVVKKSKVVDNLQRLAPDIFVNNYARKCQSPSQPTIINYSKFEDWKKTKTAKDLMRKRGDSFQAIPFPKDDPKWMIICFNDEYPYPGVKPNTNLSNKDKYPYLPCCFRKDQTTPDSKSHYKNYLQDKPPRERIGSKAEYKITTKKILEPDKIAYLPKNIEDLLKLYSHKGEKLEIFRYGIIFSPNSFLHIMCIVSKDKNYMRRTVQQKEQYVGGIRKLLLDKIDVSLLRQELYDYSDEEIEKIFKDETSFFDPSLFYRAIEEIYNVNIYVFTTLPSRAYPKIIDEEPEIIEVPRYKLFHVRPLRPERFTVLVIKNWGSESDALDKFPQCELIIGVNDQGEQIKLFYSNMAEICHNAIKETIGTISFYYTQNLQFEGYLNIYYYIDFLSVIKYKPISQYIDRNGKTRAITFELEPDKNMTIITFPSQPINCPFSDTIYPIDIETVFDIFEQKPIAVSYDKNNNINGLWFSILDIEYGIYIPLIPNPSIKLKLPQGPPNPLIYEFENVKIALRISQLRRMSNIIVQVIRWVYNLAYKNKVTVEMFQKDFITISNQNIDSLEFYDLSQIPRRLPDFDNHIEALNYLHSVAPTLVSNDSKFIMYNEVFANRIIYMLNNYIKTDLVKKEIKFIKSFFQSEHDFNQTPNALVFLGEDKFNLWLESIKMSQKYNKYFNIYTKIKPSMSKNLNPYIYQNENGKYYIIQNVVGGTKEKALEVARIWFEYNYNIGSNPIVSEGIPIHIVYCISPNLTLIPIEDNTNNLEPYVEILYYGTPIDKFAQRNNPYAAMLELI